MDFLPALRMTNIFPRNPAKDRPFGMPDIDSGNVGAMLRQIIPLAESLRNSDTSRQKDLMQFQFDLANRRRPGRLPMTSNIAGPQHGRSRMPVEPGMNVRVEESGMTPTQQMFQHESAQRRDRETDQEELSSRFANAMTANQFKDQAEMERLKTDIAGRRGLEELRGNQALELEESRGRRVSAESSLAHRRNMERDAALARARGEEQRITQRDKPVPEKPADATKDLANKIQELKLKNPELAALIVQDPDTGEYKMRTNDPAQRKAITDYIFGTGTPTKDSQPPVMKQRNKKTGQVRISTDGGKTWKLQ